MQAPFCMKERRAHTTKSTRRNIPVKAGRPRAYSPETLLAKFEEYVEWAKNNPRYIHRPTSAGIEKVPTERPLTLSGFCIFADIIPNTFKDYETREEFLTVCARVRARIENDQLEGAMAGQFNPTIAARVLHLADRQDVTTNGQSLPASAPASIVLSYKERTIELKPEDI